jgi:SPP1 family predicted phage head-tail adaptor
MPVTIRGGELKHRIDFQQKTETTDSLGPGGNHSWSNVTGLTSIPAAIWPMSAKEQRQQGKLEMEISHQVRIRYISGVDEKYRIKFGSRYFDIVSLINAEECNVRYDIMAREIT